MGDTRKTFVAVVFALAVAAPAQVNKSNLSGVVRDSSGGAVVGAAVRLVNQDTSVARMEVTDATGLYRFLLVDLGTYRAEVEAKGFKKFTRSDVVLNAGETTTTDV